MSQCPAKGHDDAAGELRDSSYDRQSVQKTAYEGAGVDPMMATNTRSG